MQEMKQIRVIDKYLIKVIVSLHLAFTDSLAKGGQSFIRIVI